MDSGKDKADWIVQITSPFGGIVYHDRHRANFTVSINGRVDLVWRTFYPMDNGARDAAKAAVLEALRTAGLLGARGPDLAPEGPIVRGEAD
ncbi:MAG: hypothetical protein ACRC67_30180 [Inquilinus sp.]|uniref:hypothetical protein n=1 Tax=Inquilinus sp. TaxID=1932117 RepID=UPI003F2F7C68